MKTTLLNISKMSLLLFLGLGTILISCSGEDGKDGIDGEMGIQGEQGPAGQDGNANVIVSDWMHISWSIVNSDVPPTSGRMYFQEIPGIDNIEDFVETGGVILVYLKHGIIPNGGLVHISLLPYQDGSDHLYTYISTTTAPQIYITGLVLRAESNDVTHFENNDDFMVKYVVVPANIAQNSGITSQTPKDFDEVVTLLGVNQ
ncbi:hypothetical protein V1387_06745 [Allomuricauda taeanensis]|uniref:hypothetical protein n=1 Tax=Flagellimonas taeanensis TaxID=1005926 RepID=UPI002E7ADCEF|nr:hypothetical protein [Allomuricauda taeanensis]MEE1962375.1 hypothetical protein [Allomuricauda taeanensis]